MTALRNLVPFTRHGSSLSGFDDVERMFDNFFRNAMTHMTGPAVSVANMAVRLDVSETDKAYIVQAELPGLEEKEVEVTLDDGILTIAGEKKHESEEEGKTFHRIERSFGRFMRSLQLPADADDAAVKADMKKGVLHIEIGKRKEAQKASRKIEIKGS